MVFGFLLLVGLNPTVPVTGTLNIPAYENVFEQFHLPESVEKV